MKDNKDFEKIQQNINKILTKEDIEVDKVGSIILLHFLLKNNIKGQSVQDAIYLIKQNITNICNGKFSRFIDQDITSTLFALYIFDKYKIKYEKPEINVVLNELKKHYSAEGSFFKNNVLFTTLITLSLLRMKSNFELQNCIKWLKDKLHHKTNGNAKVSYFFHKLLEENHDADTNKYISNLYTQLQSDKFNDIDRIHLCNTLWENRTFLEKKEILNLRKECYSLINFGFEHFSKEENPISKINLGSYINLVKSFFDDVIILEKEDFASEGIFIRLFGLSFITILVFLAYKGLIFLFSNGIVGVIQIQQPTDILNFKLLWTLIFILFYYSIALLCISIFINTCIRYILSLVD